mmetsp:Transcript_8152/g.20289  ORF Transcript_8152/g.20289 Transcript_8152/m.20289 type:complete len:253 (-) Transcript_8152:99-857(-)
MGAAGRAQEDGPALRRAAGRASAIQQPRQSARGGAGFPIPVPRGVVWRRRAPTRRTARSAQAVGARATGKPRPDLAADGDGAGSLRHGAAAAVRRVLRAAQWARLRQLRPAVRALAAAPRCGRRDGRRRVRDGCGRGRRGRRAVGPDARRPGGRRWTRRLRRSRGRAERGGPRPRPARREAAADRHLQHRDGHERRQRAAGRRRRRGLRGPPRRPPAVRAADGPSRPRSRPSSGPGGRRRTGLARPLGHWPR